MTTETVTSPAGELIDIIDDDEWLILSGTDNAKSLRVWHAGQKRWLLRELWERGSQVDEKSGRASSLLMARIESNFPQSIPELGSATAFSGFMKQPLNEPAFKAVRGAKRTYWLGLVAMPRSWYDNLMRDIRLDDEAKAAKEQRDREREAAEADALEQQRINDEALIDATTNAISDLIDVDVPSKNGTNPIDAVDDDEYEALVRSIELDAPTIYGDSEPPLDISIASQVAMSLLTTVVEIITAGSGAQVDEKVRKLQGDLNEVMTKLSSRLEENDRLRRQLRQAGDEITALRTERDGLRSRLRATEANLTAALKGDAVQAINGEIMRRVDSIMRVAPVGKGE